MLNFADAVQARASGLALVVISGEESVRAVMQALPTSWPQTGGILSAGACP